MRKKWEFVVSVSCGYHLSFAALSMGVWLTNHSSDIWIYCNNDEWTQLFMVIIRTCVRIFALLYGILRMNRKPRKLAKVIGKYCNWTDQSQQSQIDRMLFNLIEFPDGFRVLNVRIERKHLLAIVITAATTSIGSLAKSKFSSFF